MFDIIGLGRVKIIELNQNQLKVLALTPIELSMWEKNMAIRIIKFLVIGSIISETNHLN